MGYATTQELILYFKKHNGTGGVVRDLWGTCTYRWGLGVREKRIHGESDEETDHRDVGAGGAGWVNLKLTNGFERDVLSRS